MTPIEMLDRIVKAERSAREVYYEADTLRECFESYVNEHVSKLKEEYYKRAKKEILKAKIEETERADAMISELNTKLKEELKSAEARFENEKDAIALKIFKMVVDADA